MTGYLRKARFRVALWVRARSLPLMLRHRDLGGVLAIAEPGPARPYEGLSAASILEAIRRTTRHPWFMRDRRCLRQGLLGYRFLVAAGFRPVLHFGVDHTSLRDRQLRAHCWVVLDGRPVLRPPGETMVTILAYDGQCSTNGR